ncbi:MAG TPA: SUMF1/EgtB/PvdO family nonheme iron enzyme, partial [Bacteroidales bacterium]|nr:SUMF1/EgtB/PvdO family nonheme iron enzyme [Bacteroidales bacterium]
NITSQPAGAQLFIDNQKVGATPYTGELDFGSHTLKLVNNTKTVEEIITVTQSSKTTFSFDVSETKDFTETVANLNLEMVFVKGGTFTMGCTSEQESDCNNDEKPSHQVTISDFYIGKYEVTQKQWREIMGDNPSYFKNCDNCPVEQVSWNDIQKFIEKLNQRTGKYFRLPTEAEWEFAARGGRQSRGFKYAGSNNIGEVAEYDGNNNKSTKPVGGRKANELGIYDMSGNVWEWCSDWYGSYSSGSQINPQGPSSGSSRVLRGGGWLDGAQDCRVSYRNGGTPDSHAGYGFRLAIAP